MKNKQEFKEFMTGMGEVFDKVITQTLSNIYWKALEPFEDEQCKKAFNKAIGLLKWFPKPVELVEIISGGAGSQLLEDRAITEAIMVLNTVKRVGVYNTILFDDPVTTAVVQQGFGGWIKTCGDLRGDNEKWFLKDFAKQYQAFSRQGITSNTPCVGLIEIENEASGYLEHIPEPIRISGTLERKRLENH